MNMHALAVVLICAAVTIATRALPFVCFGGKRGVPRLAPRCMSGGATRF